MDALRLRRWHSGQQDGDSAAERLLERPRHRLRRGHRRDGAFLRIVDVKAALGGRGYNRDGYLSFQLEDSLCPWNSGRWALEVEGGQARLRQSSAEPALLLMPRSLAMLSTGFQRATALARLGLAVCDDERELRRLDHLFETSCAPVCLDHF